MSHTGSSILWRCRRGIREMDLLLQRFVETRYDTLSDEQKSAFSELLEQADLDIMDWIMKRSIPPTNSLKTVIQLIRDCNTDKNAKN